MSTEPEKAVSVDNRVILLAIGVLAFFALGACTVLMVFYINASNRYTEQKEITLQQAETISTMQRSLDRAEGRLGVYETYLVNRNVDIVRNLIAKFLKDERKSSAKATVRQFEGWMGVGCAVCPDHTSVGGH